MQRLYFLLHRETSFIKTEMMHCYASIFTEKIFASRITELHGDVFLF